MKTRLFYAILTALVTLAVLGAFVMFALGSKEIFGSTKEKGSTGAVNGPVPTSTHTPYFSSPTRTPTPISPVSPLLMP